MGEHPPNPQPDPAEPWLDTLTFEQAAQLVAGVSPEVFYLRAAAFDRAGARIQDVLDQVRREMNTVREVWTGRAAEDFDAIVREVTAKVSGALHHLQQPGYGATLRAAGDRLADHQRRLRDLQGQKTQAESAAPVEGGPTPEETAKVANDSAKQIVRDLRTAYWEIGNGLPVLPYKAPQVVADTTVVDKGQVTQGGPGPVVRTAVVDPNGFGTGGLPAPVFGMVRSGGEDPAGDRGSDGQRVDGAGYDSGDSHDQTRQDGYGEQTLGRTDPTGYGWGAPVVPGSVFACGQIGQEPPAVLGQRAAVTRGRDEDRQSGGVDPVPAAVLGKPAIRAGSCGPEVRVGPGVKDKETARERLGVKRTVIDETDRDDELPEETEAQRIGSGVPVLVESGPLVEAKPVKTTVESPPLPVVERSAGVPAVAGDPVSLVKRPVGGVDLAAGPGGADAVPPIDLASRRDIGDAVPPLDPVSRRAVPLEDAVQPIRLAPEGEAGKVLPVSTGGVVQAFSPDGSATAPESFRVPGDVGQVVPGPVARVDPHQGMPMGGIPMSPMMMGGMGGGLPQQGGRMTNLSAESRDAWDGVAGAPNAIGKREPGRDDEPCESQKPVSAEEAQARLADKLAELDRLIQRRK